MSIDPLHTQHEREFEGFRYVYPVLSRRSGGISVGINLNPDKVCNFHCIYCQVDRVSHDKSSFVDSARLVRELDGVLQIVTSGRLFETSKFRRTPARFRALKDIAFSGDGEPTTYRNIDQVVQQCAEVKRDRGLNGAKMVLITNASMLDRPATQRALSILDVNQGEIWAKLDAGSEAYFQQINRAAMHLDRIVANIIMAAQQRPVVIQTLLMRIHDVPPSPSEIDALCCRYEQILKAGGHLKMVQICTVARKPTEPYVGPLQNEEVDALVQQVRQRTGVPTIGYYGCAEEETGSRTICDGK